MGDDIDALLQQADAASGSADDSIIDTSFWDVALGGGSASSAAKKDVCVDGDYSSSEYDGTCGIMPKQAVASAINAGAEKML